MCTRAHTEWEMTDGFNYKIDNFLDTDLPLNEALYMLVLEASGN